MERIERHTATGWWLEEAGGTEPLAPLDRDLACDVVVLGGGYTGMWTAWHLLAAEPSLRVVLLEGGVCGHGPSGRNGGFCESLWHSAAYLRERFGDSAALALMDASIDSVRAIGDWCREQEVDAWYRRGGYMSVSTAPPQDGRREATVEAAAALGVPERVAPLDEAAVRARCDSPVFRDGILIADEATVQPARLALGLRQRIVERGVRVFERSRAVSLSARPGGVVATTERGTVRARTAVLAIGPRTRAMRELSSRLTVTSSHIVLTEPVPDVIEELGWTGGEGITDARTLVHYFRTTKDGRIVFGWGGGRVACGARVNGRSEVDPGVAEMIHGHLLRMFPMLRGRRIGHAWGGPIDVSPSHIPQVGTLEGAPVHYAFGYTGNGVGPSHLVARALASLALDRRDDASRLPIVEAGPGAWVPPEPIAWLGGLAIREAFIRRERIEEDGQRPDLLTRAVCTAPAALGIHLAR
ncbi:MAG TPA: FAD-binding oxidoreductase [Thermoleophilaceae bacterium]